MANAGTVNVNLVAQTASFVANMKAAGASVDGFGNKLGTIDALASSLGKLALRASPIAALGAAFKVAFSEASRIDNISDATGLAASEIVGFERAALKAGVGVDGLTQAVMRMNVVVGQAIGGNEEAAKKLAKIGIATKDLLGLSPAQQFEKIGVAIGSISDQAVRAAMSQEILGKNSAKLVAMLQDLNKKQVGQEEAERIDRASAALNRLTDSAGGYFANIKTRTMTYIGVAADFWDRRLLLTRKIYGDLENTATDAIGNIAKETIDGNAIQDKADYDRYIARTKRANEAEKKMAELRASANKDALEASVALMDEEGREKYRHTQKLNELDKAYAENGKKDTEKYLDTIAKLYESHDMRLREIRSKNTKDSLSEYIQSMYKMVEIKKRVDEQSRTAESMKETDFGQGMSAQDEEVQLYKDKNLKIQEQLRERGINEAQAATLREDAERAHNGRMQRAIEMDNQAKMAQYSTFFGNISTLASAFSEQSIEMFRISQIAAIAQAEVNAWMAYSQIMASPFYPELISKELAAGMALAAGQVAALNIAKQKPPGRANGGAVNSNSVYGIAEKGPELLSVGDDTFLATGSKSGRVQPLGAGGSPRVTVNVNNLPGQSAQVTQGGSAESPTITIDIVDSMVAASVSNSRSQTSRAMQSRYGLNAARGAQ